MIRFPARAAVCASLFALAPLSPASASAPPVFNLQLPSDATGGGHLAVRVTLPPPSVGPRYSDGAPVLVLSPGGHTPGSLTGGDILAGKGFAVLTFLYPGGSSGPYSSDGLYDYRGALCRMALRDVILFAAGLKTDTLSRTIHDVAPIPVRTGNLGVLGSSNGGPATMATLANHGSELPALSYFVGWENPTGGQTVLGEVGVKDRDCDPSVDDDGNGVPDDDGDNPYITAYSDTSITIDFTNLAFDPTYTRTVLDPGGVHAPYPHTGVLFIDGNANGTLDFDPSDPTCLDLDGNGTIDIGEDYFFNPLPAYIGGALQLNHSNEVTRAAAASGVYGASWPSVVADTAQASAYWELRDPTTQYDEVAANQPGLRCMLAFGQSDHVQAHAGHPHIQQAYHGLTANGLWCRLNPDEVYYREVVAAPALPPTDTDAGIAVAWPDMWDYCEPYGLSSNAGATAGVMEMADRTRYGVWSTNLDALVTSATGVDAIPPATATAPAARPNPFGTGTAISWTMPDAGGASLSIVDVRGRVVRTLTTGAMSAGPQETHWDGLDNAHRPVPAGVYFARIAAPGIHRTVKLTLIR
ncbi:MAG: FlgD immunoglobulin-like domain containing protein [Gemmatimonadota bacterium]|jgi:hypothetical protein|nr:FlgD immunoglobulin-like domain containing protein [Gemmatimonadota bacterium]MDP6802643.1 FlgD immunoglobulin-like domain containing protein [Gemmatimonadota bacterium]MDP7031642.1 FlgD immunoglobulin-like domain containing protein [Gemmatimonadota bacterium]